MKTDYKGYALVYSCNNYAFSKYQFVWIFSRDKEAVHFSIMEELFQELKSIGYDPQNLELTR